ncbi:Na+/H+ antiporter subunit E [Ramlibacter humi]|uniref:Na+/H+ antiporter subunit E n=1 Tax=Ramlibacter humi TaxID=2530451 RepID=A0A4Z0BKU7_9BURK|nr:Na+/H+ antiporter subunit E [Ramlibacter humi]TFY99039.1 Na+/H+ antiporter subunit E [Ramlibacter humi]
MKRLLPYPLLAFFLLLAWLALNDTLEPAQLLIGIAAGVAGAAAYARLEPPRRKVRRLAVPALQLLGAVALDIVQSNLAVARIALRMRRAPRIAGFLRIPLELGDPAGLAVLACIVTATPGTSWARYDAAASVLTLHVLDLADEQAWVLAFKRRYERRLLEIFG